MSDNSANSGGGGGAPPSAGSSGSTSSSPMVLPSLKAYIRTAVHTTNQWLATAHDATDAVRVPLLKGLDAVGSSGSAVATQALHVCERRREYGPYLVTGTAVASGGFVAIRRGRYPGLTVGLLAGGLAYLAVYESIPLQDVPDYLFGKKDGE